MLNKANERLREEIEKESKKKIIEFKCILLNSIKHSID